MEFGRQGVRVWNRQVTVLLFLLRFKKRGSKANMVVCLIFYTSYTTAALCYEPIPTCTSVEFSGVQEKNIDYLTRVGKVGFVDRSMPLHELAIPLDM